MRVALAAVLAALVAGPFAPRALAETLPPPEEVARIYLSRARETQTFSQKQLMHLVGGPDCARATALTFRHSSELPDVSEHWYLASQIWADLALARTGDQASLCQALRGLAFLEWHWDADRPEGGYFARLSLGGDRVIVSDKYADDNALVGLVWADLTRMATTSHERQLALGRARATADWLMNGDVWDNVFGGGFWWNNRQGDTIEGKPAQTNALAAQFFLELYELSGDPKYREAAVKTLHWMGDRLWDERAGLYRWAIYYENLKERSGEVVARRFFNYDQGIMIEAHLLAERLLDGRGQHLARARMIAERLDTTFWDPRVGGYDLEAGVAQVFPTYSAWLTQSLLALYEVDRDVRWLERARGNVEALNDRAWDPAHGGYYNRYYVCRDEAAPGCKSGVAVSFDPAKHTAAQAWMQRAQALLSLAQSPPFDSHDPQL